MGLVHPQPFLADCPRCSKDRDKKILKYRGSVKRLVNIHEVSADEADASIKALKEWLADERVKRYMKYSPPGVMWSSIGQGKGKMLYHYTFIACDECISPEDAPAFTHFPDGWEMTVFKTKDYGPYDEEMNFDALNV